MKHLARFALVATLAAPALAADTKITTALHTDESTAMGQTTPAKDSTRTTWIGKERMRIEEDDKVTIVRADLKKMYFVHPKDKTYSVIDLPFDMKKYVPPEMAQMADMMGAAKVTLTPTKETKKIKDWNTTKYTMTTSLDMMGTTVTVAQDMWVTKDTAIDTAAYADMHSAIISMLPGGAAAVAELKKIEGVPVLTEMKRTVMGTDVKSKEEVTTVEAKDAPEGAYDLPKDFKEKPFDVMSENPMGGPGAGGRPRNAGAPPVKKPVDPPK